MVHSSRDHEKQSLEVMKKSWKLLGKKCGNAACVG